MKLTLTFLGTGTSTGIPQLGCSCHVCTSSDPKDKRLRASALIEYNRKNIIIDCGPDFYVQMLRYNQQANLDAALITHIHYDHVGGVDDLRPYCKSFGFPFYCTADVSKGLHEHIPYCFAEHPYPGVPHFDERIISWNTPFTLFGLKIIPLKIMHAALPITGYKIGDKLAYITDAKTIPEETLNQISGIDTLILNALRIEPHHSHLDLDSALQIVRRIAPRRTFFIHLSHHMGTHKEASRLLPENVFFAYDGLQIEI